MNHSSPTSAPAISIEELSKMYAIGARVSHDTLYDVLTDWLFAPLKRFRRLSGHHREAERIWALEGLCLEVAAGEVLGVIGRNGAGKSTLLKVLSRITEPSGGKVTTRGRVASLLEVGTGFHPELTGRENIYLNGAILGMSRREITSKFDEIVEFAGVEKFLETPVKRYSSGMYVRLAFAVAAHLESEILLVDEVLAVGDTEFQKKCLAKMGDIRGRGKTVLFVSHNMGAVSRLCDRVAVLEAGQLVALAQPREAIAAYMERGAAQAARWVPAEDGPQERGLAKVDQALVIRSVAVTAPAGHAPTEMVVASEGLDVVIDYEVVVAQLRGRLSLRIDNAEGIAVFGTANTDGDAAQFTTWRCGRRIARCAIPGHLLVPGRYRISVAWPDKDGTHRLEEHKLGFEVDGETSLVSRDRRFGAVAPLLRWTDQRYTDQGLA